MHWVSPSDQPLATPSVQQLVHPSVMHLEQPLGLQLELLWEWQSAATWGTPLVCQSVPLSVRRLETR